MRFRKDLWIWNLDFKGLARRVEYLPVLTDFYIPKAFLFLYDTGEA